MGCKGKALGRVGRGGQILEGTDTLLSCKRVMNP